jgi:hypothetical protein
VTATAVRVHSPADKDGFVEWKADLDQLVSDVVSTLEYSPYSWTHRLDVAAAEGLTFRGDRFVALGEMEVEMEDYEAPEGSGVTITRTLTRAAFVKAIREVCAKQRIVVDREAGGEIDADIADAVLQTAVYGQVVFG